MNWLFLEMTRCKSNKERMKTQDCIFYKAMKFRY
jgi:hypothetical protein